MERHLTGQKYPWVRLGDAGIEANEFDGGMWPEGHGDASTARGFFGHTTSVLLLIVDVTPKLGCIVRLVGSKEISQMPASPVCRDTLVSATVGAAINLFEANSTKRPLSATRNVEPVVVTKLTFPVCVDIKLPLLLP